MSELATTSRTASTRRVTIVMTMLVIVLLVAAGARLLIGEPMPRDADGGIDWPLARDYLMLRSHRLIIAATVGAALAAAGVLLQALLRNPLASPYLLGISGGAALGVMCVWAGWVSVLGMIATHTAAFIGAMATMAIVYLLAQRRGRIDTIGLLLVGVIVNSLTGAAIMLLNYLLPQGQRSDVYQWLMGYLNDSIDGLTLSVVAMLTIGAIAASFSLGRAMDVATFSDAEAHSLGVNLPRLRLLLFALAGLLTAGSVVLAGPIAFVGLICPHLVRLLIGPTHRPLLIGSAIAGAALVIAADAAIKAFDVYVKSIGLMPVGVLTAIIGGPVFLLLLRPQLGRSIES